MPALDLKTNVQVADVQAFVTEFSALAAKTLSKPEGYISVVYTHNPHLSFAGTFEPALLLHITSLGNVNEEANEGYSKVFFEYFKEKLGVTGDRGYITFFDPGNENLGHRGTTFATIFGKK